VVGPKIPREGFVDSLDTSGWLRWV
jgi:hypothetical protein